MIYSQPLDRTHRFSTGPLLDSAKEPDWEELAFLLEDHQRMCHCPATGQQRAMFFQLLLEWARRSHRPHWTWFVPKSRQQLDWLKANDARHPL